MNITSGITTGMDWKGAIMSSKPYYTNNLILAPEPVQIQMQKLQTYQPDIDGPTNSSWVSNGLSQQVDKNNPNVPNNLDYTESNILPNDLSNDLSNNLSNNLALEGFSLTNPYIHH
jgi:hypothetical protein